jgi:hypothetical protein
MASRFWVGGTGTWDGSTTTNWAATSGGAGGQSVPGSSDTVTFDASSGGGTVTVAASIGGTETIQSLTAGAFTGTLDFSANNPSITFNANGGMSLTGTGARKFLLGSGTFTFTASAAVYTIVTGTNVDPTSVFTANFAFTGNTATTRFFLGGGRTYGALTVGANTSRGILSISGANTFSSMTVGSGNTLSCIVNVTQTISGASTFTGTAAAPVGLVVSDLSNGNPATLSFSAGDSTMEYGTVCGITTTGSGTFVATNSFNNGRNTFDTGDSVSAPSVGGGVVGVIGG